MDITVEYKPTFPVAVVSLKPKENFIAQNGSMLSMSKELEVETTSSAIGGKGGILRGLGRMLGGESFFNNIFTARLGSGEVLLAPTLAGDIVLHHLQEDALIVQAGSWLGSGPNIGLETKWGGMKSFLGGEGLFMLRLTGDGPVLFSAFGAIHCLEVKDRFILDTGHIVAFEQSLDFKVKRVGGWFSTFFSGEGLVCEFQGRGRLWFQSRNPNEFGRLIGPDLPERRN